MKQLSQGKGILIFWGFDIILLLVLLISFLPNMASRRNSIQSAVLNEKYKDQITDIKISIPELGAVSEIHLVKENDVWTGTYSQSGKNAGDEILSLSNIEGTAVSDGMKFPADSQTVENFISTCSRTVTMYRKSTRKESWDNLNVDEESGRHVVFASADGEIFSDLYYGVEDPITQRIAVRSTASDKVLDTENKVHSFLTSDKSFWADPFIYPQCITGYDRNTSENLLRRGKLCAADESQDLELISAFEKTFENENKIVLKVYKNNSSENYIVKPQLVSGPLFSEDKGAVIDSINYVYTISQWTFESLKESN